jgi:hypothetical protein
MTTGGGDWFRVPSGCGDIGGLLEGNQRSQAAARVDVGPATNRTPSTSYPNSARSVLTRPATRVAGSHLGRFGPMVRGDTHPTYRRSAQYGLEANWVSR